MVTVCTYVCVSLAWPACCTYPCLCLSVSVSLVEAEPRPKWWAGYMTQWNLSIKGTLNKGHLSNEGTVCSPNHLELCANLPLT